jgi:hypothetical protein
MQNKSITRSFGVSFTRTNKEHENIQNGQSLMRHHVDTLLDIISSAAGAYAFEQQQHTWRVQRICAAEKK